MQRHFEQRSDLRFELEIEGDEFGMCRDVAGQLSDEALVTCDLERPEVDVGSHEPSTVVGQKGWGCIRPPIRVPTMQSRQEPYAS